MYLGSHEKHNLPLIPPPSPERPPKQPRVPGRPGQGVRLPLACCHSPQPFLSANQTTLPGSCRAAFIPLPAWPCASARKMPSATQKPTLGFAWEETTAPESGPSGPALPAEEAP